MTTSGVVPVIVRDAYTVLYEAVNGRVLCHATVRRWTATTARQFRADIATLQELLGDAVYVVVPPGDALLPKFLKVHQFTHVGTVANQRGAPAQLFARESPRGR